MPYANINSMDHEFKQNIKAVNVLEENMGECFYNFGKKIRKIKIQNTKAMKERIDIYDCTHFFFF